MFKIRNLVFFVTVFGLSLVNGAFADEPSKAEAAATTTAVASQPAAEVKAPEETKAAKEEKKEEIGKDKKAKAKVKA